jgi:osmotically-inducible protein OsmY
MVFPYWLWPDDDDHEEAEISFEWADEVDWVARRSADEWLVGRAAEALATDPQVHGRRLEIVVQNGVVILLGELGSAEAREAAGRRAWTVEGVMDVCNRLTVTGADEGGR